MSYQGKSCQNKSFTIGQHTTLRLHTSSCLATVKLTENRQVPEYGLVVLPKHNLADTTFTRLFSIITCLMASSLHLNKTWEWRKRSQGNWLWSQTIFMAMTFGSLWCNNFKQTESYLTQGKRYRMDNTINHHSCYSILSVEKARLSFLVIRY